MNAEKLYRAIGAIDSDIIDEAAEVCVERGSIIRRYTAAYAAVAVLCAVCAILLPSGRSGETPPVSGTTVSEADLTVTQSPEEISGDQYALILNTADSQYARMDVYLQFSCELDSEQINSVFPGMSQYGEMTALASYDQHGELKRIAADFVSNGSISVSGTEAYIRVFPNSSEAVLDYLFDCQPQPSYIMEHEIIAGQYALTDETVFFASFAKDGMAYYIELSGGNAEKAALPAVIDRIICGGKADVSCLADPVIPELRNDELDEQQAYGDPDFGAYLPQVDVNGLSFEFSRRYIDQNSDYLSVLWSQWKTQGYDQLYVTVSRVGETDLSRIVAPGETERYDLSLYPIPRAESVPDELYEVVDDPIFRAEEMTLEEVYARAYITEEIGDSDGYRMGFSVMYGEILVKFDSKGQTPEEIYDMITEILEKF